MFQDPMKSKVVNLHLSWQSSPHSWVTRERGRPNCSGFGFKIVWFNSKHVSAYPHIYLKTPHKHLKTCLCLPSYVVVSKHLIKTSKHISAYPHSCLSGYLDPSPFPNPFPLRLYFQLPLVIIIVILSIISFGKNTVFRSILLFLGKI